MRYLSFLFYLGLMLEGISAYAHKHHAHAHQPSINNTSNQTIRIALDNVPTQLIANQPVTIRFQLLDHNKAMSLKELKEVHTQKIHVLLIDPCLHDYHHVHPVAEPGTNAFVFRFTPKKTSAYQMWVDITPAHTSQQQFLVADLGSPFPSGLVQEKTIYKSTINPYTFALKLDGPPKAGAQVMATITVTKNGEPFTQLEPVMGTFAHVVGFSGDHASIIHIHPMGKEPNKESDRGGSELMFHIGLQKTGYVKLFAQFKINEHDVYVPFAIKVS